MAGKLCPQCKQRTLFVSGDNERTCTKCGYSEKIDPFAQIKDFLGSLFLTIIGGAIGAWITASLGFSVYGLVALALYFLLTLVLLIISLIKRDEIGHSVKRIIMTVVLIVVAIIVFAMVETK